MAPVKTKRPSHWVFNNKINKWMCKKCKKSYKSEKCGLRHLKCPKRPFNCQVANCKSIGFFQLSDLKAHQLVHTRNYSCSCVFCPSRFPNETKLNRHILLHIKEFEYLFCEKCGKQFESNRNLKRHLNRRNKCQNPEESVLGRDESDVDELPIENDGLLVPSVNPEAHLGEQLPVGNKTQSFRSPKPFLPAIESPTSSIIPLTIEKYDEKYNCSYRNPIMWNQSRQRHLDIQLENQTSLSTFELLNLAKQKFSKNLRVRKRSLHLVMISSGYDGNCKQTLRKKNLSHLREVRSRAPFTLYQGIDYSFQKIQSNQYPEGYQTIEMTKCVCPDAPGKCSTGECHNRSCDMECTDECGKYCENQRIKKKLWVKDIKTVLTRDKGFGVFASSPIQKETLVIEFCGQVITQQEFLHRQDTIYKDHIHQYSMQLEAGYVIDCQLMGTDARTINHSCAPNCNVQKWIVDGYNRIVMVASKDIAAGEELTYDYKFYNFNQGIYQFDCKCGSVNCRGKV